MIEQEIWKDIPVNTDYEINQFGIVRSKDRIIKFKDGRRQRHYPSHYCKININPVNGYLQCTLSSHHKATTVYIHRLVAELFVEKPMSDETLIVNHKDGNKLNCVYTNLEWVTYSQNSLHSYNVLHQNRPCSSGKRQTILVQYDHERVLYPSITKAAADLGICKNHIRRVAGTGKIVEKCNCLIDKM